MIDGVVLDRKVVAGVAPNFTADALVRPVPVMVTVVPPVLGPEVGRHAVTVGTGGGGPAGDGHVLDLVDVVEPSGRPGEAERARRAAGWSCS